MVLASASRFTQVRDESVQVFGSHIGVVWLSRCVGVMNGSFSCFAVEGGHRAIIFSRISGVQKIIKAEGIHFRYIWRHFEAALNKLILPKLFFPRIPWFQWPIIYEIRARPKQLISPTGSKDLQMVNIGLRVLYRPQVGMLPDMYRQLGTDYDDRVLPSICNEVSVHETWFGDRHSLFLNFCV